MISDEEKKTQARGMAIAEVAHGAEKVGKSIDSLSSSNLKRVLKRVTHVHAAEAMLQRVPDNLSEKEQILIDNIFALQESVLGASTLFQELEENKQEDHPFVNKESNNE